MFAYRYRNFKRVLIFLKNQIPWILGMQNQVQQKIVEYRIALTDCQYAKKESNKSIILPIQNITWIQLNN